MILREISLENFGLYAGKHMVNLAPQRGQPVVLFGGKNGAGKTTLLEAVRLALYGKRALGIRVGQSEYEQHLLQRTHADKDGRRSGLASVALKFDYAEAGRIQHYLVARSWAVKGEKVIESLRLEKDGEVLSEVPTEEWHFFLQELIPPGVSQLFFFDGEKIADLAHDNPDETLAEAIKGLLGFELVGRLRTDIGLFQAGRAQGGKNEPAKRLEAAVRDLASMDRKIAEAADDGAEADTRFRSAVAEADTMRRRFTSEGGDAARNRADLEGKRAEITEQITARENDIREMMGGLLPVAMAPKLAARFASNLDAASLVEGARFAASVSEKALTWRATGDPERKARWTDKHWTDLDRFLNDQSSNLQSASRTGPDIDTSDRQRFAEDLTAASNELPHRVSLAVSELDRLAERAEKVDRELKRASGKAAGLLLDDLLEAERGVAVAEAQFRAKREELRALEGRKVALDREKRRALDAQNEAVATEERIALAGRVGRALKAYEERLLDLKISQLRSAFVDRFNYLVRKEAFVADVEIDPETFAATLINAAGSRIPKSSLSAGEKQIYAIAMLWALARTSGRSLPMIIDTPLARLDGDHRTALVERYFAKASHQVIVLSTDTEIDTNLREKLAPSVSHSYHLAYDNEAKATTIEAGYFGDIEDETEHAVQQA